MKLTESKLTRRSMLSGAAAAATVAAAGQPGAAATKVVKNGRLRQSVCKWCYRDMSLEDLSTNAAAMGIAAIDLLTEEEWPVVKKHGLVCAVGSGVNPIPDGLNTKANNVPNLICFSGNRRNVSDEEAWENCALLLNKVKGQAEDLGVTIIMELLNSKVNHKDYQCDKTAWGVELVNRVNSPRFKLLYDIYHMQIMEGDVIRTIRENKDAIAHYHTGGNPGRNEIDETQELNYKAIAQAIVDIGFQGYYAHEFIPLRDPMTSLQQAVALCDV